MSSAILFNSDPDTNAPKIRYRRRRRRPEFSLRADVGLAYDHAEALALAPLPRREFLG